MAHRSRDIVQVQQGSLYPALHRLEEKGWLNAEWRESEQGRMARFYSLTKVGRRQLATEKDHWARLLEGVGLILQPESE
jgi:DNA-binding PadR family transcriptional regulator